MKPLLSSALTLCFLSLSLLGISQDDQPADCCFDATCFTCEDIASCGNNPILNAADASVGGTAVCGVDHPTTNCSTFWENNTMGVQSDTPQPTDPNGCLATPVPGCTDASACNYNSAANEDDGSCDFSCISSNCNNSPPLSDTSLFFSSLCAPLDDTWNEGRSFNASGVEFVEDRNGKLGDAIMLDASGHLQFSEGILFAGDRRNEFAVSCWFKLDADTTQEYLFVGATLVSGTTDIPNVPAGYVTTQFYNSGISLYVDQWQDEFFGSVNCSLGGNTVSVELSPNTIELNAWQHIVINKNGELLETWINGNLFHTDSISTADYGGSPSCIIHNTPVYTLHGDTVSCWHDDDFFIENILTSQSNSSLNASVDVAIDDLLIHDNHLQPEDIAMLAATASQLGCVDASACNYDAAATIDDGSCEYTSCQTFGCTDPTACNYEENASFENGTCDFSCYGCTDPAAANHDGSATIDDGSCQYAGCTDPAAVNYDATADVDDASCSYPGCTDPTACNHDTGANSDDGSCDYSCIGCTDATACNYSADATQDDGSCDFSCYGCIDSAACNHDSGATQDDGSCSYPDPGLDCAGDCLADADGDGVCDPFEVPGCTDAGATNFDASATDDDGSCTYPAFTPDLFDFTATPASGSVVGQVTFDGVAATGNDWIAAFDANGQCAGATQLVVDNGTAYFLLAIHGDDSTTPGVDEGMNEGEAFSLQLYRAATETYHGYYTANGTTALEGWTNTNGSPIPGLDNPSTEYAFNSAPYSPSCLDPAACNYDPASPGNLDCQYPDAGLDCNGDCLADDDGDGVCNDDEVDGCTDSTACNYEPGATDDDGSCQVLDACGVCGGPGLAPGTCDCAGNVADAIGVCGGDCAADADADGICDDVDPCVGNYDACGLCNGPGAIYDCGCEDIPAGDCDCDGNQLDAADVCGGDCTEDADGDGVCDDVDACIGSLDSCGICNGPGAVYGCGCEELPDGNCDCNGNVEDAIGVCGGTCAEDLDGDGICDDSDPCIGTEDACGVCDGPGAIYDCGCSDIPEGDCDCDGNQLDALGVCGGPCAADADGDGLCDDVDDCVGDYDACGVCNGPGAVYECGCEDIPAGDCDCNGNQLDALGVCGGTCTSDQDDDGVCDDAEILGCTDNSACNYAASATEEDGSCIYPPALYDCAGDCLDDTDGDGICDALENSGCTDPDALNYNALATDDDGSCTLPEPPPAQFDFTGTPASATLFGQATLDGEPCGQGDWIAAFDPGGNCAGAAQLINYDGAAYINLTIYGDDATTTTVDEGINAGEPFTLLLWDASVGQTVAYVDAFGETELTGWSNTNGAPLPGFDDPTAIYNFLSSGFIPNCLDPAGCNYDPASETSEGCVYPETGYDCNGDCLADQDEDGICDPFEIPGCTDTGACNYDDSATDDDDSCTYPADGYDCAGECLQDTDGDGVCDPFEIPGCSDTTACNYNAAATDPAECTYPDSGYDCAGNCLEDSDEDGVCDPFEIVGCQDPEACNYDASATDSGTCTYPATPYEDCDGTCFTDLDGDGVCDELDDCVGTLDGEGNCDEVDIPGCTYTAACNYDADANLDDGTCQFVPTGYDCDGNCLDDTDGDGVCDPNELPGCDDPTAANYSPLATDDDGSCQYGEVSDCPMDLSGDGVVGIADILQILSSYGLVCPE